MPVETEGRRVFGQLVLSDDGRLALHNPTTNTLHLVAKHGPDIEKAAVTDNSPPTLPRDWTACRRGDGMTITTETHRITNPRTDTVVIGDDESVSLCPDCRATINKP